MGLCMSSNGAATEAATAQPAPTALVLLPTGELREYARPATAARALGDVVGEASWFLCDSDRMGFEGPVAAVPGGEALRAGRIYFVLPAAARRRGLAREEVAALAVRAAAALAASAGTGRRRRAAVAPLVFSTAEEEDEEEEEVEHKAAVRKQRPRPAGRGRRFAPDLTAIPEGETSE
jgi:hypothetical protein